MPRTVLLADDSVTAQNMGRRILTDAGYEVITVNNGSAALKKIHESPPDLIVLDVYMPGYGGLEVCQRLKESGATMKIPVLLTVGKMEPFKSDDAKRVSADGHIVKPFDATELLAALTRLEDRIVPQSAPARASAKRVEKTRWFWHSEETGPEPAPAPKSSESSVSMAHLAASTESRAETGAESKDRDGNGASSDAAGSGEAERAPASDAARSEPANSEPGLFSSSAPILSADFHTAETTELSLPAAPAAVGLPTAAEAQPEKTEAKGGDHFREFSVEEEPALLSPEPVSSTPTVEAQSPGLPEPAAPSDAKAMRWVAEKVELTAAEASVSLEEEMRRQQASMAARENQPDTTSDSAASESAASACEPSEPTEATAAAAPSASPESATSAAENRSGNEPAEVEPKLPSEAQAAWENWEQIRESVMQPGELLAKVAEAAKPPAEDENEPKAAAPALESAALASIVDSVLAELKPRLMEEIAKKLVKDKK